MPINRMYDFIEKVVYINLESRKDRREQIEQVLSIFPKERVERFEAIYHSYGALGCSKSHVGVLELAKANNWKNVLIVEDDMFWSNFEIGIKKLEEFANKPYDVILLGSTFATYDTNTGRVSSAQTATGYLVSSHYYERLLENYKEGNKFLEEMRDYPKFALDQYWKKLQAIDNWYMIKPSLCIQTPGYSDIEKGYRNYTKLYE